MVGFENGWDVAIVVQEKAGDKVEGPFLLMSGQTYCDRYLSGTEGVEEPWFALNESGITFRDSGTDVESHGGASARADFRKFAAAARFVTYSGDTSQDAGA